MHALEDFEVSLLVDRLWRRGQGLVEYALILALVAVVVIVVLVTLGPAIGNTYSSIIVELSAP